MIVVRVITEFLYKLYAIRRRMLRSIILRCVSELEGGQIRSVTLRRIFLDYHQIEIGLYSHAVVFYLQRVTAQIKIGGYCSLAEGVDTLKRNHPIKFKSTHPYFFNTLLGYVEQGACQCVI